jgi:membrane protease YdiL (CAAX protease family)
MDRTSLRVLIAAVGIIFAYMAARAAIYHAFGPLTSFAQWMTRDRWMTLPRLIAFTACLWVAHQNGGIRRWGWGTRLPKWGAFALLLGIVAYLLYFKAHRKMFDLSASRLEIVWATTLAVALFEETAFRGLVFRSLDPYCGAMGAALISSTLFALYHWQAQPLREWPVIFIYGVMACGVARTGVGLLWLVIAHEIIDGLEFHFGTGGTITNPLLGWMSLMSAFLAIGLAYFRVPDPSSEPRVWRERRM